MVCLVHYNVHVYDILKSTNSYWYLTLNFWYFLHDMLTIINKLKSKSTSKSASCNIQSCVPAICDTLYYNILCRDVMSRLFETRTIPATEKISSSGKCHCFVKITYPAVWVFQFNFKRILYFFICKSTFLYLKPRLKEILL